MIHGKKIVVVMPAYNAEKTLEQTYAEIPMDVVDEVILTDDCSRDSTVAKAKELGIKEVLVSCDKDNIASAGVIRNCGGILKHELYSDTFDEMLQMYVIKR